VIYNTFNIKRKGFKDFLHMISEAYKCEVEHAKSMKKLYELNCTITNEGYDCLI
jgi:hypothetical protein